jgi:valyl-tRNA synthetase
MRLIHPFMPFVTEEIWSKMGGEGDSLAIQEWPKAEKRLIDKTAEQSMQTLIEIIATIRNLRTQWNIDPSKTIDCLFTSISSKELELISHHDLILKRLAKTNPIIKNRRLGRPRNAATRVVGKIKFFILLEGIIDIKIEKEKMLTHIRQQEQVYKNILNRLKNKTFLQKAPREVIEKYQQQRESLGLRIKELKNVIQDLE